MAIQIYIANTVVEFDPSEKKKNFQGKTLQRSRSVDNRIGIVNTPSKCLPRALATSMQSQKTIRSTYMDNNILYQGLIPKNNPNYMDAEAKQGSSVSYQAPT